MIVFDLACPAGHVFEAWFGSQADYDGQRERGLVSCPICGNATIEKAPMAPRIATSTKGEAAPADPKAMLQKMMAMQAKMLNGSEDVGHRFADEARAIHSGESDSRTIHGQTTPAEARKLAEEGVPVAPLPFPVRNPASEH